MTSYLDLSIVYGSSQAVADAIRAFRGGRLTVEVRRGREYPPTHPNRTEVCDGEGPGEACYLAGESLAVTSPCPLQLAPARDACDAIGCLQVTSAPTRTRS